MKELLNQIKIFLFFIHHCLFDMSDKKKIAALELIPRKYWFEIWSESGSWKFPFRLNFIKPSWYPDWDIYPFRRWHYRHCKFCDPIRQHIVKEIGSYQLMREHNSKMSEIEYREFWAKHHNELIEVHNYKFRYMPLIHCQWFASGKINLQSVKMWLQTIGFFLLVILIDLLIYKII